NCQTGGLTTGLRLLLPNDEVQAYPYAHLNDETRSTLVDQLRSSDVWVVTAPHQWIASIVDQGQLTSLRIVTAPELYFDAFHPDLVYAWLTDNRTLDSIAGPYNAAIGLSSWWLGLDA